jgi:hypothetical protein
MSRPNQKRLRNKGRATTGSFVSLPHDLLSHDSFATLRPRATKLLIDIAAQYRGSNNGDLCAPLSLMKKRGWNSSDQLFKAKDELVDRGLILVSRQGGLNQCNLYAITWQPIDECKGKLDIAPTHVAPHHWKRWIDPKCGPVKP